jgi:hypothetical protein
MVSKCKSVNKTRLNKTRLNKKDKLLNIKGNNNNLRLGKMRKSKKGKKRLSRMNVNRSRKLQKKQRGGYTTRSVTDVEPQKTDCIRKEGENSDYRAFQNSFNKPNYSSNSSNKSFTEKIAAFFSEGSNGIGTMIFQ